MRRTGKTIAASQVSPPGEEKQQEAVATTAPPRQPASLTRLPVSRESIEHCGDTQAQLEEAKIRVARSAAAAARSPRARDREFACLVIAALAVVGFTGALLAMTGPLVSTDPAREAAVLDRHSEFASAEKYVLTQQRIPASQITSQFIAAGAVVRLLDPSSTVVCTGVAILVLVGSAYLCWRHEDIVRAFAKPKAD
jgi:hypothetical protein